MHDHNQPNDLESIIATLPLREPSTQLDERIAAMLSTAATTSPSLAKRRWTSTVQFVGSVAALLALAAGTSLVLWADLGKPSDPQLAVVEANSAQPQGDRVAPSAVIADRTVEPVNLTWSRDLVDEERRSLLGSPYHAVVREIIEQQTWHDPATDTTVQINVPRHEILLVAEATF